MSLQIHAKVNTDSIWKKRLFTKLNSYEEAMSGDYTNQN